MKQISADIVIVGSGASGLAAAVAAAEKGASVVAFDKNPTTGGTGKAALSLLAVNSKPQRQRWIDLTVDDAFNQYMYYTHMRTDGKLTRKFLAKTADTIDWLCSMGVVIYDVKRAFNGSNPTEHVFKDLQGKPSHMVPSGLIQTLTDRAKDLGVEFYLSTPVKKILKADGKVCGVLAETKEGEEIEVRAKAVLVGTGGFGNNPDMIREHCGLEWGQDIFNFRMPGNDGDGLKMAWEAGAARSNMMMELTCKLPKSVQEYPNANNGLRQPNLAVNLDGERVMDEAYMENMTFCGNTILLQRGKCIFNIMDATIRDYYKAHGLHILNSNYPGFFINGFEEEVDAAVANPNNHDIYVADTLEELAEQTGINAENLKATVEQYNKYCETGYDEEFGKDHRFLRPLKEGPYYAGKFRTAGYGSLGGIKINHNLQVLDDEGMVIPGFYAMGTDANNIFGDSYVYVMPGSTMSFAVNSGRMAGENAADYAAAH